MANLTKGSVRSVKQAAEIPTPAVRPERPVKQTGAPQTGARWGWLPYSQRRVTIVAALWALAFAIVAGLALYFHANRSAQLPGEVGLVLLIQLIQAPLIVRFINLASDANWPVPAGATVIIVTVLLVIFRRWRYALSALIAGFLADVVNVTINGWVQRPRPHNGHIHAVANLGLYSFPSGHVSHVTAFYGFLLFLTFQELRVHPQWVRWIRVAQAICIYFLLFIGLARLLAGAHYPTDVLASYLLGGMIVVVAIVVFEFLEMIQMRNNERALEDGGRAVRRAANNPAVLMIAHAGYAAKAVVYLIIGGLALAAALKIGGGLTDQTGAAQVIYRQPFGAFLLILSAIGWLIYALWCVLEGTLDTEHKGTDAKGIITRVGYAAVGVTYAALALAAFGLATGKSSGAKSSNTQAQDWTARLLSAPGGVALVLLVSLVVLGIAGLLFYRAYSADFRQQLELGQASPELQKTIILLGRVGNAALGVVFTIIGVFLIVAAVQRNPSKATGLSGALGALLAQPLGNLLLAIVALGLLAYGVYSIAQARYRRIQLT